MFYLFNVLPVVRLLCVQLVANSCWGVGPIGVGTVVACTGKTLVVVVVVGLPLVSGEVVVVVGQHVVIGVVVVVCHPMVNGVVVVVFQLLVIGVVIMVCHLVQGG